MISVIIPTLNEERALPATLASVASQPASHETIVVDGGSTDATRRVFDDHAVEVPHVRWVSAPRGRARQMNAGARAACGDWLLFLHADTILPNGALVAIDAASATARAGCFHHRFSGSRTVLRLLSWLHNRRFGVTRVIYGDQAMFIDRDLFDDLGGFPDRPMEDIAFGLALRRVTRPVMLAEAVVTDSRKFEAIGPGRAVAACVSLLIRFRLGRDVAGDPFFSDVR